MFDEKHQELVKEWEKKNKLGAPPEQWYNQKLDHFDPQNTKTFKHRYFVRK